MVFPIARRVRHGFEQNEKMPRKWQRPLCRCGSTGTATGGHMPTLWGRRSLEMNRIIRRCPRLACEIICKLYIENSKVLSWGGSRGGEPNGALRLLRLLRLLTPSGILAILRGSGATPTKKWRFRVGVVTPTCATPTQNAHLFRELATVSHGIAAPAWNWRQSCTESNRGVVSFLTCIHPPYFLPKNRGVVRSLEPPFSSDKHEALGTASSPDVHPAKREE